MGEVRPRRALRRAGWSLLIVVLVAAAVGAGWWAGRTTLTPATTTADENVEVVTAGVVQGSVGRTQSVGVTLRQPVEVTATNTMAGMVTEVRAAGDVTTGEVVYVVAGAPVRVVAGQVPFYRELARGDRGVDVTQLQEALVELGHLRSEPDGIFGAATHEAVRAWQGELGIERTGVVALGEVLAVPRLPAPVTLGADIRPGVLVSGGEVAILTSSGAQEFTLVLSADQAATITSEVRIQVFFDDLTWEARVAGSGVDEGGFTVLDLVGRDGGLVCDQDCDRLPPDEQLSLRAEAIITPEISGPVVPVAAVRTSTDGDTYVVLTDGTRREVTVLGSGQGVALVQGMDLGEQVVISGFESADVDGTGSQTSTPDAPGQTSEPGGD